LLADNCFLKLELEAALEAKEKAELDCERAKSKLAVRNDDKPAAVRQVEIANENDSEAVRVERWKTKQKKPEGHDEDHDALVSSLRTIIDERDSYIDFLREEADGQNTKLEALESYKETLERQFRDSLKLEKTFIVGMKKSLEMNTPRDEIEGNAGSDNEKEGCREA
jgi:hypothetical protein